MSPEESIIKIITNLINNEPELLKDHSCESTKLLFNYTIPSLSEPLLLSLLPNTSLPFVVPFPKLELLKAFQLTDLQFIDLDFNKNPLYYCAPDKETLFCYFLIDKLRLSLKKDICPMIQIIWEINQWKYVNILVVPFNFFNIQDNLDNFGFKKDLNLVKFQQNLIPEQEEPEFYDPEDVNDYWGSDSEEEVNSEKIFIPNSNITITKQQNQNNPLSDLSLIPKIDPELDIKVNLKPQIIGLLENTYSLAKTQGLNELEFLKLVNMVINKNK